MSTDSLLWVPAIAMLLFTVTYICFILIYIRLSRLLLEGRTKIVSAIFFFESHLQFYSPHYPGAGMELSEFAGYIGWRLAF